MEPKGRARSKGRSRGGPGAQGAQAPGPRPGPAPQQQRGPGGGAPPAQQAPWSRPPLATQAQPPLQPQAAAHWVRPQMVTPAVSAGRGSRLGGGDVSGEAETGGAIAAGGDAASQERGRGGGNGGVRGRSNRNEIVRTRPETLQSKKGTSGTPLALMANYFQLLEMGKWVLNQYRVDFSPDIDHTGKRKFMLRQAMQDVINGYLFDGTAMYTPHRINPDPLDKFVQTEAGENVRITVRLVGDVVWGDHHYIQLFNIIIRKCLTFMKFQLVGRDYYDPDCKVVIPEHKLELWPGYFTSMRQHEQNILLNIDVKFKIIRVDNVYDMLLDCQSSNFKGEFQSKVIGNIVLTFYNNKTYRIDDVDFSKTPESTFPKKDGTQISFIQYYQEKYNIQIQIPTQPLLVSRSKAREIRAGMSETVLLIPELCQMTGLTDKQRDNFHLMRAMAEHTRVAPDRRVAKLLEFSQRIRRCPEATAEIRKWDLTLAEQLIRFQGRVLPQETIVGGNNQKYSAGPQADWTRELRALPMLVQSPMQRFAVICPVKFRQGCQEFVQCLQKSGRGMNFDVGSPKIFDINDDRSHTYLDTIENIIQKHNPTLIMCIVPNNSADRYSAIKKKCCVDRGVPTQVILSKNLVAKGVMSIATKVVIQINCKIGGAPWTVVMPLSGLMVVGYDVCRDTAKKGQSFAAMVASIDKQVTRFFNYTSEHSYEEELSDNFAAFLIMACHKYKEVNGKYPERILIYRDAVGDGQLPYVVEHEVENIKKKLTQDIYKGGELKMAFVVVSKRINTRIFTDRSQNPPPGTVVDDVVTLPERYDFFIVSQCVRQGTVSPTSYNVIYDSMGLPPDRMQMLTYKLCHMYFNWSGTVRVPAPVQYAHKLAFLTAQSLHRSANRALENVLYYL